MTLLSIATPADLVRLESVSRFYDRGRIRALDNVSLAVAEGQTVGIIGRSGSGKSTLLSTMVGLASPESGRVLFRGTPINDQETWAAIRAREVGIVFQAFHLIPTLSAAENVEVAMLHGTIPHRRQHSTAVKLLKNVGLAKRFDHLPNDLSGGERQRVAIARSFANEPSLIVADEPTGNLDRETAAEIMDLLFRIQSDRGTALVIATHDREILRRVERRLVIDDGSVSEETAAAPGGQM